MNLAIRLFALSLSLATALAPLAAGSRELAPVASRPPRLMLNSLIRGAPVALPPARENFSVAYDAARGQLVLFGGDTQTPNQGLVPYADTWTSDGSAWTQRNPAHSPPARWGAATTYDGATASVLLFGGVGPQQNFNDTWTWDGSDWTEQLPSAAPATAGCCQQGETTYDSIRRQVVFFAAVGTHDETWTWSGSDWMRQTPASSPPPRRYAAFAFDATRGVAVLFGGCALGQNCIPNLDDTWTWDGSNWSEQATGPAPPPRAQAVAAFDPSAGQTLLFGGSTLAGPGSNLNDAWVWDGSWAPTSLQPAIQSAGYAGMFYADALGGLILVGADLSITLANPAPLP
jgi:hypothetical protein